MRVCDGPIPDAAEHSTPSHRRLRLMAKDRLNNALYDAPGDLADQIMGTGQLSPVDVEATLVNALRRIAWLESRVALFRTPGELTAEAELDSTPAPDDVVPDDEF